MADDQPAQIDPPAPPPPSLDHPHTPSIPSPLNPDTSAAKAIRPFKPPPREQREKRDTLKKRESTASGRADTPTMSNKRKAPSAAGRASAPSPMRYAIEPPKLAAYEAPKDTVFMSHEPLPFLTPDGERELRRPIDRAENKRGYRYSHAIADPLFPHKQHYRSTSPSPHAPHLSFEDADKWMHFSSDGLLTTNEKGWRTARANVCVREGTLYYEVRIMRAVPLENSPAASDISGPQPHVRVGWARREAPLDAPVGFDGYSYGITDIRFETMHRSRSGKFFHPKPAKKGTKKSAAAKQEVQYVNLDDHVREGDVLGLEIQLPSLSLHQKIINGIYNPAVDIGDGFGEAPASYPSSKSAAKILEPGTETYDVIRDRIPVPYKGNTYFEVMDHIPTKPMESYADRTISLAGANSSNHHASSGLPNAILANSPLRTPPNPNHPEPSLRTLPHSAIRVYKNGLLIGTAFENLLAFLPPASSPGKTAGAREGFDDAAVGYFPAVSCFWGGMAEVNFGETADGFWAPPAHLATYPSCGSRGVKREPADRSLAGDADADAVEGGGQGWNPGRVPRAVGERYREQIAEDVLWDIVDEADFFVQDGGYEGRVGAGAKVVGAGQAVARGVVGSVEE
ncbi:transcription factor, contains a PHD finger motif [Elasticomyces elasticus]|nr:transcription factor, contains a PHD finger motif [Elasticomyces elasticus]